MWLVAIVVVDVQVLLFGIAVGFCYALFTYCLLDLSFDYFTLACLNFTEVCIFRFPL